MIEDVLFARLSGFTGLAALVGARIYPIILPQDCLLPAVTYRRVATPLRVPLISGDSGTVQAHFEVTAWAATGVYDQLRAVALQLRLALQRWHDDAQGVDDTHILDESEDFQPEALCFYRMLTAEVDYEEEVP